MRDAYICDAARTPIGRYGGVLAKVRTDDLAATPIKALVKRNAKVDWSEVDEVFLGCANQAGEDNRNVARMALLLAGLPDSIGGVTLNRLCASGLEATGAISAAKNPAAIALPARCWERQAKASWSLRATWNSSATFSPVSGIESTPYCCFISGLTKRQPMVVSNTSLLR